MNRSQCARTFALTFFLSIIILGRNPQQAGAQTPKAALIKNLFSHVMKSAEVDAQFAKIQDSWDAYVKTNSAVTFRVVTKKTGMTNHSDADEYWIIRKGAAKATLQGVSGMHDVAAGDVAYVPRSMAFDIDPAARLEYVALRIFPPQAAGGAAPTPAPTSYFATKAQIDKTFATESASVLLNFPGGGSLNEIIYNGATGPYESHEDSDQIYFVRYGSAKIALDGRLVNPVVTGPGQIRGTGYIDSSEYTIGPGDIVWIPRNTLHFVDPGTGRVGYLLSGIPTSQSALPAPPPGPARGRGAVQ